MVSHIGNAICIINSIGYLILFNMYRYCLAYCYADILMTELTEFQSEWNTHYMRRTHGARCPAGVPGDLFYLPEMTGCILLKISIIIIMMITFLYTQMQRINYTMTLMENCG